MVVTIFLLSIFILGMIGEILLYILVMSWLLR